MNYLITNARIVNEGSILEGDVLIEDGLIKETGKTLSAPGARVIDARGRYLIPGIIDEHVHFREPGLTHKADILTESRAAVAGGVTSFMDMPNTVPQTVTNALLEDKFRLASEKSLANYSFYLGATNDNLGEILRADISKVCGIKLFMGSSTGNMLVSDTPALESIFREAPCLIAAHCEDESTIAANTERFSAMAANGEITPDAAIHPKIRSSEACLLSASRAVELALRTGARLHLLHVSTAGELNLFRSDIPLGEKKITAETCPHYLYLTEKDYARLGFSIKCNPAIKSQEDAAALLGALKSGLIDTIGSDHAPHLQNEKNTGDYFSSKSGFPSIQHTLQVMMELSRAGWLPITDIVRLMCHNPATLYGIDRRGFIRKGYHADLAIVDPDATSLTSNSTEHSKCRWTPFDGLTFSSAVTHTFVSGNLVYENGHFHEDSRGEMLRFRR